MLFHPTNKNTYTTNEDDNIDKPFMSHFADLIVDQQLQPLPFIGIQPIQANYPGAQNDAYTNAQAVWLIETELEVDIFNQVEFTHNDHLHAWKLTNIGMDVSTCNSTLNNNNQFGRPTFQNPPMEDLSLKEQMTADNQELNETVNRINSVEAYNRGQDLDIQSIKTAANLSIARSFCNTKLRRALFLVSTMS